MAEQILSLNKLAFQLGISRNVLEAVSKTRKDYYKPFVVSERKRDGRLKERKIDNPNKAIRKIQQRINKKLLAELCENLPAYTTGSIPKRSTYQNAQPHITQEAILLIDISDCFPSIRSADVYKVCREMLGCSPVVANLLTKLTTYGNRLPQGAPTSPSLCNLVLAPLSEKLNLIALKNNLMFTQYVDDLTFSGSYSTLYSVIDEILGTIEKSGFKVNRRKLKLIKSRDRMEITGLVVNSRVSVGRKYIRMVQRDIMKSGSINPRVTGRISYIRSISKSHARKLDKRLNIKTESN